ncbi:MAG TPA: hypothetical protein VIM31_00085 [Candidatus Microsaccharimonas sp.]|jgi:hypothetical protein
MGHAEDIVSARREQERKSQERISEANALDAAVEIETLIPQFLHQMEVLEYPDTSGIRTITFKGEDYISWELYIGLGEGDINGMPISLLSNGMLVLGEYGDEVEFDMAQAIEKRRRGWEKLPANKKTLSDMLYSWTNPQNIELYYKQRASREYYYKHGAWPESTS